MLNCSNRIGEPLQEERPGEAPSIMTQGSEFKKTSLIAALENLKERESEFSKMIEDLIARFEDIRL